MNYVIGLVAFVLGYGIAYYQGEVEMLDFQNALSEASLDFKAKQEDAKIEAEKTKEQALEARDIALEKLATYRRSNAVILERMRLSESSRSGLPRAKSSTEDSDSERLGRCEKFLARCAETADRCSGLLGRLAIDQKAIKDISK